MCLNLFNFKTLGLLENSNIDEVYPVAKEALRSILEQNLLTKDYYGLEMSVDYGFDIVRFLITEGISPKETKPFCNEFYSNEILRGIASEYGNIQNYFSALENNQGLSVVDLEFAGSQMNANEITAH